MLQGRGAGHDFLSMQNIDVEKRYSYWNKLYQSVDLYINMPIMGINEIMTQKIVLSTNYSNIIQSCMRGRIDNECGKCIKCFKTNINAPRF